MLYAEKTNYVHPMSLCVAACPAKRDGSNHQNVTNKNNNLALVTAHERK